MRAQTEGWVERIGEDRVAGVGEKVESTAWRRRGRESVLSGVSGDLKGGGLGEERTMESE